MIEIIIDNVPAQWNNKKFEQEHNCRAFISQGVFKIVSEKPIADVDQKIAANIAEYLLEQKAKAALLNRLGITAEEAKLLLF